MQPIQTIVLATDFSDQSRPAEEMAVALAESNGATLFVVHGIEPIIGLEDDDSVEFEDFYRRLCEQADAQMEQRMSAWGSARLSIQQHVRIGHRWRVVLEAAESEKADLIILGRRNFNDGEPIPQGTTSQKVFFGAARPVLFVPIHE